MARKPKLLKSGELSEQSIQCAVMQWVRMQPKIAGLIFHIPNEGKRAIYYKKLMADMGVVSGVADLFIAMPVHGYHGSFLELKSIGGRLSPSQKKFFEAMKEQHYFCAVAYTIEEAINHIAWYCNL